MSTSQQLESTVRTSRLARSVLDLCLLAALLGVFIQLNFLSDSHRAGALGKAYLAKASNNTKPHSTTPGSVTHIEEFHDTEATMWNSFFRWYGQSNYASGNCYFMAPNEQYPGQFQFQCTGENAQSGLTIHAEPLRVFVADVPMQPQAKALVRESDQAEKRMEKPRVVEGWLDTAEGRKYFDPVAKRWTP